MANKLYDENAVSDIADAIREKNGTTDTYTVSQMGDAVRAIPTGGGAVTVEFTQSGNWGLRGGNFTGVDTFIFHAPISTSLSAFQDVTGIRKFIVDASICTSFGSLSGAATEDTTLQEVEIISTTTVTNFTNMFRNRAGLKKVLYTFDFSSSTNTQFELFYNCKNLEEFTVVPNCIKVQFSLGQSGKLTDTTIIGLANALSSEVSKTLNLHHDIYDKMQTMMGDVVDGLFVADESGTVTLSNFVTQTKGWTLGRI